MRAVVSGMEYRLRFTHFNSEGTKRPKKMPRGATVCSVELKAEVTSHNAKHTPVRKWLTVEMGDSKCGHKDNYTKETGRQFAMVRAIQAAKVSVEVKAALIDAYLRSSKQGRELCEDMKARGYKSLYEAAGLPRQNRQRDCLATAA